MLWFNMIYSCVLASAIISMCPGGGRLVQFFAPPKSAIVAEITSLLYILHGAEINKTRYIAQRSKPQ